MQTFMGFSSEALSPMDTLVATTTKPALVMLISPQQDHWITTLANDQCDFFPITNVTEAVRALQNVRYDLIVIDDDGFANEATRVVQEIKRRNPTIPVIMVNAVQDDAREAQLFKAGADDFLTDSMSKEEVGRHLTLMLKQHRQNRALAQRTQNLHAMASLSRLLYNAQEQNSLLYEAAQLLINTYRLYGVAFVLRAGDVLHLYAGSEQSSTRGRMYESILRFDRSDPFCWTLENNITQVYQNISDNPNYSQIPVLGMAESCLIVPLVYQDQTLGAMAIFAQPGVSLSHEDLIVFEPFAAQFVVALQKVAQYQAQYVNVQSSQHLLRGWERFSNLNAPHEVATALRELVEEVPHAGRGLVWLYDGIDGRLETALVDSGVEDARTSFQTLVQKGVIGQLIESLEAGNRPLLFDGRETETGPLLPLFHALLSVQVLFLPIADSTRLIGGMFVGAKAQQSFTEEDVNLIENLVRISGQMFERITLTSAIWEKTGRLEAILRTISEGIFFVDESDYIGFCNPQFGEMTGIQPSEVINQPAAELLRLLASRSDDPQRVTAQLREAQEVVSKPNVHTDDYPIVDVVLPEFDRTLHIEFVKIEGVDATTFNWAGLVRDREQSNTDEAQRALLQELVTDHLRMPYAQVRTQIGMLADQHGVFSHRERDRLLHELEGSFDNFGQLWLNFIDLYNAESGGMMLARELVDLPGIVQRIISSRAFAPYSRSIQVDAQAQLPQVRGDELRLERAIANVLYVALRELPANTTTLLKLDRRDKEVALMLHVPDNVASKLQAQIGNPRSANGQVDADSFALYVSQELVARQGGHLYIERDTSGAYMVVIGLPVAGSALPASPPRVTPIEAPPAPSNATQAPTRMVMPIPLAPPTSGGNTRAPARALNSIMIVEGRSSLVRELHEKLTEQDYELLVYNAADEAIRDVNSTRLDLVIIDTALRDMNGVDVCARMRARTEVPIILISDKPSETEKVRGLNVGADDYIARPISQEEMMARMNNIFRRMSIQERTREPLQLGDLYMDFARREVFLAGKPIELTRIEYDLLHILVTNRGQVLTHRQLLEKVWGPEYENETQYLWVNISRLRKKLEPRADSPRYIQNQLGIGYMFSEP
jgi:DNA-binding response OmpR family regulator